MLKMSVSVSQYENPRFDSAQPESDANHKFVYLVRQARNVLMVSIGQYLTPAELRSLIGQEVDVTIGT